MSEMQSYGRPFGPVIAPIDFEAQRWEQRGAVARARTVTGKFYRFGWAIEVIPQFGQREEDIARAIEFERRVQTTFDALQTTLTGRQAAFELRLESADERLRFTFAVSLFLPTTEKPLDTLECVGLVNIIQAQFPLGWDARRLKPEDLNMALCLPRSYHVITARKRISALPIEGTHRRSPRERLRMPSYGGPIRWAPVVDVFAAPSQNTGRADAAIRTLVEGNAPVLVRIALQPARALMSESRIAYWLDAGLEEKYRSQSGEAPPFEIARLRRAYQKYTGAPLHTLQIQAASPDAATAQAALVAFLAQLGMGPLTAQVHLEALAQDQMETVSRDWLLGAQTLPLNPPVEFDCYPNPEARAFLCRLPHLLEETEARFFWRFFFPIADDRGMPGLHAVRPSWFTAALLTEPASPRVRMGQQLVCGRPINRYFSLPLSHFTGVISVSGNQNTGKTTFIENVTRELRRECPELPILLIEPTRPTLYEKIGDAGILRLHTGDAFLRDGKVRTAVDPTFLRLNFLQPVAGTAIEKHIDNVKTILMAAWKPQNRSAAEMIIWTALKSCYVEWFERSYPAEDPKDYYQHIATAQDEWPDLEILEKHCKQAVQKNMDGDPEAKGSWMSFILPRMERLRSGTLGEILDPSQWRDTGGSPFEPRVSLGECPDHCVPLPEALLHHTTLVDLSGVAREDLTLLMMLLLAYVYESALAREAQTGERQPEHCLILDEAHWLFENFGEAPSNTKETGADAAAYVGAYLKEMARTCGGHGQLILLSDQLVDGVPPELFSLCSVTATFQQGGAIDRELLRRSLGLTEAQAEEIGNLPRYQVVIKPVGSHPPIRLQTLPPGGYAS